MTLDGDGVRSLRAFVPAKDFAASRRFYLELGFTSELETEQVALMTLGRHSFFLQNFHVEAWAENCMMQLALDNLDDWWNRLDRDGLAARHGLRAPVPPRVQTWGLKVAFLFDPSGVLWHMLAGEATLRQVSSGSGAGVFLSLRSSLLSTGKLTQR